MTSQTLDMTDAKNANAIWLVVRWTHRHHELFMMSMCVQGERLRIVGVEQPQTGCEAPSMLELKTSSMQIVRLPLDYAGNFQEFVDHDRLYTLGTPQYYTSTLGPPGHHNYMYSTHSQLNVWPILYDSIVFSADDVNFQTLHLSLATSTSTLPHNHVPCNSTTRLISLSGLHLNPQISTGFCSTNKQSDSCPIGVRPGFCKNVLLPSFALSPTSLALALQTLSDPYCQSTCVPVCLSATLMLSISETKRFRVRVRYKLESFKHFLYLVVRTCEIITVMLTDRRPWKMPAIKMRIISGSECMRIPQNLWLTSCIRHNRNSVWKSI